MKVKELIEELSECDLGASVRIRVLGINEDESTEVVAIEDMFSYDNVEDLVYIVTKTEDNVLVDAKEYDKLLQNKGDANE
ncbi:hypothetical protein [Geomicrobium sediminis]|uniref:Energy-converting hydrogenase A subunit M n=1 Tax=Geomicrobium sediminis TaxID=1347788 RepID=A0ABS2PEW2_9BACL|nr:hypothetical protein [Geomicrobium sediminis]MBM7633869.1 energy-converting hydrogenase A subunit M [Geomicrobium sediminis]